MGLIAISNLHTFPTQCQTLTASAEQNLSVDPYGRVIDITFNQPVVITEYWDRFRFTINMVAPMARDGGAFKGDFNNDGIQDFFLATFMGQILFFPGIKGPDNHFGQGSLIKFKTNSTTDDPYFSNEDGDWLQGDVADFDGDGTMDIIVGGRLYKNSGTTMEPLLELVYQFTVQWDPAASAGDLNHDGKTDIVITHSSGTEVFWNNSTPGVFNFSVEFLTSWGSSLRNNHLAVGDLNGDQLLDLASPAGIYYNTGSLEAPVFEFSTPTAWNKLGGPSWEATSDQPAHVFLKDMDGDGLCDAYISNLSSTIWQALYYKNTGSSGSPLFEYIGPVLAAESPLNICYRGDTTPSFSPKRGFVATADIDNNGKEDLLLSQNGGESFGSPTIIWNLQNTDKLSQQELSYQELYTYPEFEKISSVCDFFDSYCDFLVHPSNLFYLWEDFTNDGLPDVLCCDQFLDAFVLYQAPRLGNWPFSLGPTQVITSNPSQAQAVARGSCLFDLDLDGVKDIVGGSESGELLFYRNLGTNGTLTLTDPVVLNNISGIPVNVGTQSWPTAIDLDGDGDMDFLVATESGLIYQIICLLPGNINGFESAGPLGTLEQDPVDVTHIIGGGTISPSLTTIDLDNDGLQDIVMADANGAVWSLINTGTASAPVFSLQPFMVSETNAANLEKIDPLHYRLYFAYPTNANQTVLSYHDIEFNNNNYSGSTIIAPPSSTGNYNLMDNIKPLIIYPNPSSTVLSIEGINEELSEISIFSSEGKLLFQSKPKNNNTINISMLSSGLFIIKIRTPQKTITQKFIKR